MKKLILLLSLLSSTLFASLNVVVSYPYIAALTTAVGGDKVSVTSLAKGNWDPHFVVPRPSLIRVVSRADLLIINGAQLEIGWMPPLINRSHNSRIQPGTQGFLDLSHFVALINKPTSLSRSGGDIHPDGNPHYATDPFVMPTLANAIAERLSTIDPDNEDFYQNNAKNFGDSWQKKTTLWSQKMAPLKGLKVVQYHELFNYFLKRFHLISIGNIEPLPGISPSSSHTLALIKEMRSKKVKLILQDVYHSPKTARFIAEKTGARVVILPHDVGALKGVDSLRELYDTMISKMTQP